MKSAIFLIPFLLLACKKEPTPAECQSRYNSILAQYDARCNQIGALTGSGQMDPDEAIRQHNEEADKANNKAAQIEDCCCWTRIPHLQ